MKVRISSEVLAGIRAHAAAEPGREVCGLLLGSDDHVTSFQPTANGAEDPQRHFEIDSAALFAALRDERAGGPKLVGYYHSHPHGAAEPSATDHAGAAPDGKVWLILAGDAVTGWRAGPDGFEPLQIG
jgi:proteasome lid subunit RPN8/RPN11